MGRLPCYCSPIRGCGHLMSWHRTVDTERAVCTLPGCKCSTTEVCDHVGDYDPTDSDDAVLLGMGIAP